MKPFAQHAFERKLKITGVCPVVLLTPEVHSAIYHMVDICDEEVGCLGAVRQLGPHYLIDRLFIPKQQVHAATTEIKEEGLAELGMKIMADDPEHGLDTVNRLRFWGHSHHTMGTSPSGQDNSQFEFFRNNCDDFFIMGIFNKQGNMRFWIEDYKRGIAVDDAAWNIYTEIDASARAAIEAEIKANVSKFSIASTNVGGRSTYYGTGASGSYGYGGGAANRPKLRRGRIRDDDFFKDKWSGADAAARRRAVNTPLKKLLLNAGFDPAVIQRSKDGATSEAGVIKEEQAAQ